MNNREKVARHEAAHAVLAIRAGFGVSGGIDLDAPTSVEGAYGNAAVSLVELDGTLSEDEQRTDLVRNLAVICAGAAADAKSAGVEPADALRAQPGDYALALRHAAESSIVESHTEAAEVVMNVALPIAVCIVNRADVWAAIERVAAAVLAAGGQLDRDQIESLGVI
jgi:hypothetical protein